MAFRYEGLTRASGAADPYNPRASAFDATLCTVVTSGPPDPSAALAALRERYRAGSGRIVDAFRTLAQRLAAAPDSPEVIDALRRELHRVRGTAGSYGFHGVSELARQFEAQAKAWAERPDDALERRSALVAHLADGIAAQFADNPTEAMALVGRRLALLDVPEALARAIEGAAPPRGYAATTWRVDDWLQSEARGATHVVVVSAAVLPQVRGAAAALHVPLVVIADERHDASITRDLEAGDAITVVRPDGDADDVFAFADQAALQAAPIGATLLVVDDDVAVLELVRRIAEPDGLLVETLDDPGRLLETIERVQPTLLLCDVHMHEYHGTALVRGLRADPRYADLPMLLFSSEADADRRADAYAAMADDFIAKPVVPAELLRRLRARIETVRLRRLADGRHPGTGLPLPVRTLSALDVLRTAAGTMGGRMSLALVRCPTDAGGTAGRRWMREGGRLARALGTSGTVCGLVDDATLLVARQGPGRALADALLALAHDRPADAPAWRAGVVDADIAASVSAWRAAAEAALAAAPDEPVHLHEPADDARAPDVVIVEDDLALADMLQFALRAAGLSFRAYASGAEALEAMLRLERGAGRVLVLLDVDLPGLDGHTLHERLRLERPGQFAVVFCSVHGSEAEQLRAIDGGALDWLTKPISLRVLMAKVRRWRELSLAG